MSTSTSSGSSASELSPARLRALAETGSAPIPSRGEQPAIAIAGPDESELAGTLLPGVPSTLGLRKFRDRLRQPYVIRTWQHPEGAVVSLRAQRSAVRYHADIPATDAWTYDGSLPGPTIEARSGRSVQIDWGNALLGDGDGDHSHATHREPAPLPYDVVRVPPQGDDIGATIAIANQPGGCVFDEHDHGTVQDPAPNQYPRLEGTEEIRAATVVHLHGALTDGHNDGWAHNVMLPGHTARCTYPNDQESATLWYHDHAMAVTRFSVHAGLFGMYLIRDEIEEALQLPAGDQELMLVIADRNLESEPGPAEHFRPTGRLLYKQAGVAPNDAGEEAEVAQSGPFTMVNGKIWPTHEVDARWHRLRLLNASNSRIFRLALYDTTDEEPIPDDAEDLPGQPGGGFGNDPDAYGMCRLDDALVAIGTEGGLLPEPVVGPSGVIELGPGERADVLVDLSGLAGRMLELRNENATFLAPTPGQVDPTVMQFRVRRRVVDDPFELPATLTPAYHRWSLDEDGALAIGPDPERDVIKELRHVWIGLIPVDTHGGAHPQMWELEDVSDLPEDEIGGRDVIRLGQAGGADPIVLRAGSKLFDDTVRILFAEKDWALWHFVRLGGPDHPMHIHMTSFQMVDRRSWELDPDTGNVPGFDLDTGSTTGPLPVAADGPEIDPVTAGTKETWVVRAGEQVIVAGHFAGASGTFMYHCHVLDHEDHTMMRPFIVLPPSLLAMHGGHGDGGGHH